MHKRNKGKNKHKNPHPLQPSLVTQEDKLPEIVENEQIEEKSEERVPEIVAEVTDNIKECEDKLVDSPSKPKRHRGGKKKKDDKSDDVEEDKTIDVSIKDKLEEQNITHNVSKILHNVLPVPSAEVTDKSDKNNLECAEQTKEEKLLIEELVTPVARKNKKGKHNKSESANTSSKLEGGDITITEKIQLKQETSNLESFDQMKEVNKTFAETNTEHEQTDSKKKKKKNQKQITRPNISQEKNITEETGNNKTIDIGKSDNISEEENQDAVLTLAERKCDNLENIHEISQDEYAKDSLKTDKSSDITPLLDNPMTNKNDDESKTCSPVLSENINIYHGVQEQTQFQSMREKPDLVHPENPVKDTDIKGEDGSKKSKKKNKKDKTSNETFKKQNFMTLKDSVIESDNEKDTKSITNLPEKTCSEVLVSSHNTVSKEHPIREKIIESVMDEMKKNHTQTIKEDNSKNLNVTEDTAFVENISTYKMEQSVCPIETKTSCEVTHVPPSHSEIIKPETIKFVPLSESNIDESYKKLFEALLATENESILPSTLTESRKNIPEIDKKNEEFTIRLFQNQPDAGIETIGECTNKMESTDLKCKVMEVNKDMEELKLSIEKSIAELTAMESDDMPEIVAITDIEIPSKKIEKQEHIKKPKSHGPVIPEPPALPIPNIKEFKESVVVINEIPEENDNLQAEPEKQPRKNKGKGKSSKSQISVEPKIELPRSPSPSLKEQKNIDKISDLVQIEEITENISKLGTISEHQNESPKPKCRQKDNKAKNKTQQDIVVSSISPPQKNKDEKTIDSKSDSGKTEESESKDKTSKTQHAKEAKEEEVKQRDTNQKDPIDLVNVENNKEESEIVNEEIFSKPKSAKNIPSQSTTFVIPISGSEMLFENPPEENIENPLASRSKNLLGNPDIPVTSNKTDYKKEKDKNMQSPNTKLAKIKVKDSNEVENEKKKLSKHSQTENKLKSKATDKSLNPDSDNEEYVYKYSFRKVFLTNTCNLCTSELKDRKFSCNYCNLVFYCSQKHKDEDWSNHQGLCFAVCTLVHLKGLKFIYGDAAGKSGQDYRLLRMQVIISCEKILKRKLLPFEQETLLYPRMCADSHCREWRHSTLKDCEGCELVSYCSSKPEHLAASHQTWCNSYRLYHKLVRHQQLRGRLEPRLPTKIVCEAEFKLPDKINELLAHMYEEKIDMEDVDYAALLQLATAPLTAAYGHQLYRDYAGVSTSENQNKSLVLHVVGAEIQFEADTLNKWEVFFLHLRPDVQEMRVVFVGPELNPSKLPLELLSKIKYTKSTPTPRFILYWGQKQQVCVVFWAAETVYPQPMARRCLK